MRLAYLAAPYRADTIHGVVSNIRKAEEDAISLWQMELWQLPAKERV